MAPNDLDHLSKSDLFSVLESMKITIPRTSKLSTEDLTKRLRDALGASQRVDDLLPNDLTPGELAPWSSRGLKLLNQVCVMQQSLMDNMDRLSGDAKPAATMQQMQNLAMWLGYKYSEGARNVYFSDADTEEWALAIRIHEVYAVDEDTPVFVLSYRTVVGIPGKNLTQQLNDVFPPQERHGQKTNELTRRAFLRLLQWNGKKLAPGFEPEGAENKRFIKKKWKLSFVLPLAPLPMATVGKLADATGCDVCGSSKKANTCTQCLSATYCSSECQKSDWNTHRDICHALGNGTWTTINLGDNPTPPGLPGGGFMQALNVHENWQQSARGNPMHTDAIKNVHGTKAFLVKFQTSLMGGAQPNHMLMYDRQRSFTVCWKKVGDPEAFAIGEREITSQPLPKMYRWAKWTGPRTMSVCFDRAPINTPPW